MAELVRQFQDGAIPLQVLISHARKLDEKVASQQKRLEIAEDEATAIRTRIASSDRRRDLAEAKATALRHSMKVAETKKKKLSRDNTSLEKEVSVLRDRAAVADAKVTRLELGKGILVTEKADLQHQVRVKENLVRLANGRIGELEEQNQSLRNALVATRESILESYTKQQQALQDTGVLVEALNQALSS